jgi:hypothetical protein
MSDLRTLLHEAAGPSDTTISNAVADADLSRARRAMRRRRASRMSAGSGLVAAAAIGAFVIVGPSSSPSNHDASVPIEVNEWKSLVHADIGGFVELVQGQSRSSGIQRSVNVPREAFGSTPPSLFEPANGISEGAPGEWMLAGDHSGGETRSRYSGRIQSGAVTISMTRVSDGVGARATISGQLRNQF